MLIFKQIKDWYIRKHHEFLDKKFNIKPGLVFVKNPNKVIVKMVRLSRKYKANVGFTNYNIPGLRMRKDSNGYWVQKVWYDYAAIKTDVKKSEQENRNENDNWSNFGLHPWIVKKLWKLLPKWLTDKLAGYKWKKYNDQ